MNIVYSKPSIYAHIINGLLLLIIIILCYIHFTKIIKLQFYDLLIFLLLLSLTIGVHGISHLVLEQIYGF